MVKYIFQLRKGWKDDAKGRNEWADYESQDNHVKPLEGELVLEYDNGVPRLKIGNGVDEFSDLPYMSVDSFILPKQISVTLYGSKDMDNSDKPQWEDHIDQSGKLIYKQSVKIKNATITANSKIDLQPSPNDLTIFHKKDLTFVTENDNGDVTVYCIGQKPENTYTIPVTITEVICNG
jgi:hypothetical protein